MPGGPWSETFLEMMAAERGACRHTLDAYRRDLADYGRFLQARALDTETADAGAVRAYLSRAVAARHGGPPPWRAACRRSASSIASSIWKGAGRTIRPRQSTVRAGSGPCRSCSSQAEIEALIAAARAAGARARPAPRRPARAALRHRAARHRAGRAAAVGARRRTAASSWSAARAARSVWCRSAGPRARRCGLAGGATGIPATGSRQPLAVPVARHAGPPHPPARRPAAQGAGARGRARPRADLAARPAPCLRQPPARRRRRSARGAGDARPRRHRHDRRSIPMSRRAAGRRGARTITRWPSGVPVRAAGDIRARNSQVTGRPPEEELP